ncbi:SAM-dependent DNA methyltransferase [Enterococcus cecorum]|uniref:SAM-dependent DNA methyltransferase n=1 Tax=Enterococcus cecorum TaxID=44008 RepID=UPI0032C412B6
MLNYQDYYDCCENVRQHSQFERYLSEIVLDKQRREQFYDKLHEKLVDSGSFNLGVDTFKPYFEIYSAERKTNQQDYTPDAVATLISAITRTEKLGNWSAYDATAGTGALIIAKWQDDRVNESPFSYAPHRYLYGCEELADNAIPYLIHNLAFRGMNAIVIHGDTLTRKARQIYFIQNSKDDYQAYSDVNVMPHTEDVMKQFNIIEFEEEAIDHIESESVIASFALPMKKNNRNINKFPQFSERPKAWWVNRPRIRHIAKVERAKKDKIYPKNSIVIQISATKGQVGLLKSSGKVGSQYAVIYDTIPPGEWLFYYLKTITPWWFHRIQEGLNIKLEDVENIPLHYF